MDKFNTIIEAHTGQNFNLDDTIESHGCDSLDSIEIVMELEQAYGISIPDEVAERFETIRDIHNYIVDLGLVKDSRWRSGQTLVCKEDGQPYKITKVGDDYIELTRVIKVKPDEFEQWADGL